MDAYLDYKHDLDEEDLYQEMFIKLNQYDFVHEWCNTAPESPRGYRQLEPIDSELEGLIHDKSAIYLIRGQNDEDFFNKDELFGSRVGLADQLFILPVNKRTVLSVRTGDVIHRWGVPALGVKIDAIPGRLNSFCVKPVVAGFLQGQCYELCGVYHSSMPINVLVSRRIKEYENYLVCLSEGELWEK